MITIISQYTNYQFSRVAAYTLFGNQNRSLKHLKQVNVGN